MMLVKPSRVMASYEAERSRSGVLRGFIAQRPLERSVRQAGHDVPLTNNLPCRQSRHFSDVEIPWWDRIYLISSELAQTGWTPEITGYSQTSSMRFR